MTLRTLIIGGGFSGTMVAAQLARAGAASIVIDEGAKPARGVAYGTDDPLHRLNVKAVKMSAWPDRPDDFAEFVKANGHPAPEGFAMRADYGDYLETILANAVASGHARRVQGRVERIERLGDRWRATLDDGTQHEGDRLVLAIGNPEPDMPRALAGVAEDDRIDQPWGAAALERLRAAVEERQPVLVAGTSLTMIDVVLSLDAMGYKGPVTAVSRRGLVPLAHAAPRDPVLPAPALDDLPEDVARLSRWLRGRAAQESDWRLAVDSIRPLTQPWWEAAGEAEQRRFLRHARPWWDIHRHRIAPDIAARIADMRAAGWLRVIAARFADIRRDGGAYAVSLRLRGGGTAEVMAGLVVDCTGPGSVLDRAPMPQLIADGLVIPDPLGLGIEVEADGKVLGQGTAYALGTLARGQWWETTAVPDLRTKAETVARAILAS